MPSPPFADHYLVKFPDRQCLITRHFRLTQTAALAELSVAFVFNCLRSGTTHRNEHSGTVVKKNVWRVHSAQLII